MLLIRNEIIFDAYFVHVPKPVVSRELQIGGLIAHLINIADGIKRVEVLIFPANPPKKSPGGGIQPGE
jgi:hypothetical protein